MEEIKFDAHSFKIENYIRNPDEAKISLIVPAYCDEEIAKLWKLKSRNGIWKVTMKLQPSIFGEL